MQYQTIKVEHQNNILKITLNRPASLNALSAELLSELEQVLDNTKQDKKIRGVLITGEGNKAFCAGADITQLAELDAVSGIEFARRGQRVFRKLETLGIPSVAAINGYAFGGGCELAMSATIRIASQNAQFGQPEVKLGVIPGFGGTQRLSRLVGKGRALDLCLTGRFIKADEALMWGLVSEVCESEKLLSRAEEILQTLLAMAPLALESTMEAIDRGFDLTLDDALELEALYFGRVCATEDKTIGVNAFLKKEKAIFKGS